MLSLLAVLLNTLVLLNKPVQVALFGQPVRFDDGGMSGLSPLADRDAAGPLRRLAAWTPVTPPAVPATGR